MSKYEDQPAFPAQQGPVACLKYGAPLGDLHLAAGNLKCGWPDRVQLSDCGGLPRTTLAQPQQEPVAVHQWRKPLCCNWYDGHPDDGDGGGPYETRVLYTSPPARKPLTDEQIQDLYFDGVVTLSKIHEFARAIEAAHGIKDTA